ncbi:surface-adhesin E family protein [Brevundimonas sp.]|uniref:surface-adhesin E family protein n=1 Tax=Brevundimonas sp. TaxID=1871086 RepID=UPI003D6D9827
MKLVILTTIAALASLSAASAAGAEEWNAFSRNARIVYLADVAAIATVGDTTGVRVARLPLQSPAGDYSHKVDEYEIRCGAKQSRIIVEVEYGPDGAELERYPEPDAAWDDIRPNSLASFLQAIACEGARADGANAASIKAFIDGGRGR